MTMPGWSRIGVVAAFAAGLATISAPVRSEDRVVNFYNWSNYMAPGVLEDFTKETDIKVVYGNVGGKGVDSAYAAATVNAEVRSNPAQAGSMIAMFNGQTSSAPFLTPDPLLVPGVLEDFKAAGAEAPETPPFIASGGEQTNAFAAGIPTASFSGASLYFHTAGDTPGTINQARSLRRSRRF